MMYPCWNNFIVKTLKQDLFHMDNCTCHHVHLYYYNMVDQSRHVQAFAENSGMVNVSWDISYGMLLHYPDLKNMFNKGCGWPYPNHLDEIRRKKKFKYWKRLDSNKRRAYLLRIWRK